MRRIDQIIEKNGHHYEYDQNGKVLYIKNLDGLEMWFNEDEKLIKAKWKNGYTQTYYNNMISVSSPEIAEIRFHVNCFSF